MDAPTTVQQSPQSDLIDSLVAALYTGRYARVIRAVYDSAVPLSRQDIFEAVRKSYSDEWGYTATISRIRQPRTDNIIDHLVRSKILRVGDDKLFLPQMIRDYLSNSVALLSR